MSGGVIKNAAIGSFAAFFLSFIFFFCSIFIAFALRYLALPKGEAIMSEQLFFNFAEEHPIAISSFVWIPTSISRSSSSPSQSQTISSSSSSNNNNNNNNNNKDSKSSNILIVTNLKRLIRPFTKKVQDRIVSPYSQFDVDVKLDVPDSEYNQNVGMFQIQTELLTNTGETILDAMRPAVLRYRSPLVRWMKAIAYWPLHVTGFVEEKQTIVVRMFSKIRERRDFTQVSVRLIPRQSNLGGKIPEVYSAVATISLRMNILQKALYFYPFVSTTSVIAFTWFCFNTFLAIVTSIIFVLTTVSGSQEGTTMMDDVVDRIKSTTSNSLGHGREKQDKLIEAILAGEDETISILQPPADDDDATLSGLSSDIPERKDKMPQSYRKDDELRQRR
jgi:hypothetical protein